MKRCWAGRQVTAPGAGLRVGARWQGRTRLLRRPVPWRPCSRCRPCSHLPFRHDPSSASQQQASSVLTSACCARKSTSRKSARWSSHAPIRHAALLDELPQGVPALTLPFMEFCMQLYSLCPAAADGLYTPCCARGGASAVGLSSILDMLRTYSAVLTSCLSCHMPLTRCLHKLTCRGTQCTGPGRPALQGPHRSPYPTRSLRPCWGTQRAPRLTPAA